MGTINQFKFLWDTVPKKYKIYYIVYVIISIFHSLIFVALPFLYKEIIDIVIVGVYPDRKIIFYIVLTIFAYLSIRLWSLINIHIREKLRKHLLDILFSSMLEMDLSTFLEKKPGYWASIFSNDVGYTSQLYGDFLYTIPAEFITFVAILVILFIYCKPLSIVVAINLFVVMLISLLREKYVVPNYEKAQDDLRITSDHLNANLKGIEDLIHYRGESFLKKKFLEDFTHYINHMGRYLWKDFINGYFISFLNELGKVVTIGISLLFFVKGTFSFGTAVMLIMLSSMSYDKANYLVDNLRWLQNFPPHTNKIKETLESRKTKSTDTETEDFTDLILKNICFSYGNKSILKNFSLHVKKGEKVALLGKSGIGKSTILRIIIGFLEPCGGEITFISGKPKIGILFQGGHLFNRTLKENLLIAKPDASEEELVRALRRAALLDWFESLPDGFNTRIGQTGKLVSGGERSRLSIARMILFNPEIVLLDEPLSGVDKERKEEIAETLKKFLINKTCILVTHDRSLLKIVNRSTYVEKDLNI